MLNDTASQQPAGNLTSSGVFAGKYRLHARVGLPEARFQASRSWEAKKKGLFLIHRDKSTGSTLTSEVERDGEATSELSSRIAHKERARARRVKQMRRPRSPPAYPILRSVVAANCCDVFGTLSPVRSRNCDVKVFSSRTFIPSLSLLYPSPGNGWATSRPASLPELTLAIF